MAQVARPLSLSPHASLPPVPTVAAGSLYLALTQVPDHRQAQGRRHPLAAVLALACAAMLCGARGGQAIAEWGRNYDPELMLALGFTHGTPCPSTLHQIFRHLDWAAFDAQLRAWGETVLAAPAPAPAVAPAPPRDALALDGKTLRGSRKQGVAEPHLLS